MPVYIDHTKYQPDAEWDQLWKAWKHIPGKTADYRQMQWCVFT